MTADDKDPPNDTADALMLTFMSSMVDGTGQPFELKPYQLEFIDAMQKRLADPQARPRMAILQGAYHHKSELISELARMMGQERTPDTGPLVGTHPDVIIYDEATDYPMFFGFDAARDDETVWAGPNAAKALTFDEPVLTGKERERRHWTDLNGGSEPWKKARKGKRR